MNICSFGKHEHDSLPVGSVYLLTSLFVVLERPKTIRICTWEALHMTRIQMTGIGDGVTITTTTITALTMTT